jgi:isocitrate/isopropylmalate dehydrogenase
MAEKIMEIVGNEVTLKEVETKVVNKVEYLAELEAELIEHDAGFAAYEESSKEIRRSIVRNIKRLKDAI